MLEQEEKNYPNISCFTERSEYSQFPNKRGVLINMGSEKFWNLINGGGQNKRKEVGIWETRYSNYKAVVKTKRCRKAETSRDFFCLGGVRLNFTEFTWSVSYSIVKLLMFYKNNGTSHVGQ